ncbi:hypothetical protein BN129_1911 [Cronobacter sakazakii 701]|nr:hypothetical protein BN129_1911 [Cronobacter sakazakii 701]
MAHFQRFRMFLKKERKITTLYLFILMPAVSNKKAPAGANEMKRS